MYSFFTHFLVGLRRTSARRVRRRLFKVRLVTSSATIMKALPEKSNDLTGCRCKSLVQRGRNRTRFEIVLFRSILGIGPGRKERKGNAGMVCEAPLQKWHRNGTLL